MACSCEIRFSLVDSCIRVEEVVFVDHVTLCCDSNSSSLGLKLTESRVPSIRSFCVLDKTLFFLTKPAIHPKPWSDSSIPSVDVFTSPLLSCLQNLVRFGLDLIPRTSSFCQDAGCKIRSGHVLNFSLPPDEPMS